MAKATLDYNVTLTLTQDEAEVLRVLVGSVCGSVNGPRQHTDAIYEALIDAGVGPSLDVAHSTLRRGYTNCQGTWFFDENRNRI